MGMGKRPILGVKGLIFYLVFVLLNFISCTCFVYSEEINILNKIIFLENSLASNAIAEQTAKHRGQD